MPKFTLNPSLKPYVMEAKQEYFNGVTEDYRQMQRKLSRVAYFDVLNRCFDVGLKQTFKELELGSYQGFLQNIKNTQLRVELYLKLKNKNSL